MKGLNREEHEGHEANRTSKVVLRALRVLRGSMLVLTIAATATMAQQEIDASKSRIRFVSKQMNVPVEGAFNRFTASVAFDRM